MKRLLEQKVWRDWCNVMFVSLFHACTPVEVWNKEKKNEQGFMIQQNYHTKLSLLVHLTLRRK